MTIHWYPGHMHKASKILLSELRAGKLGRTTLETPKMIEQELIILQAKLEAE